MSEPRTLFEKLWDAHLVQAATADTPAVVYIDLQLIHEVTSPQAFTTLRERGLPVRRPDRTLATADHSTPTAFARDGRGRIVIQDREAANQVGLLERNCAEFGIRLYGLGSERQGIVHVIGPELGVTHPGATIVCGDSHTCTHGAFGALAFGIGTSEVGHVLATQCLLLEKPRTMAVTFSGALRPGVTAKDLVLGLIATIGAGGGTGHVIEYRGDTVAGLSMEERMTLCNMAIEAGARTGMIAPDAKTFAYLEGRPFAPRGDAWSAAVERWRTLATDPGARFDRDVAFDASVLEPMVTWGTNPGQGVPIRGRVPEPDGDKSREKALRYMGLEPGQPMLGRPVDVVFIGSCTNSRLSDLRQAASVMRGRRVAPNVRALVVPGSQQVKRQAEAEGLDRVFREAGAEWREAGCSMCIAMNGDRLASGQYAVSTSNRNFEGRQGAGGRTFLASPLTAAASAVAGHLADPREYVA
ncbi:MAG TPA: 3-isopropylmalate dehydratase large subunit [Vicinamibacteria bacterium]|nr:3-isopropylmalate dehydratase large subunit [Vicinamibacteria bacterium]